MKRRDFLLGTGALAAAGIAAAGVSHLVLAAKPAPDPLFEQSFPDLDGKASPMSQWLGKPVVANFWATWCPPCVKEMPDLEAMHAKYKQVQFLGLAVDVPANVRAFSEKVHVSYPLLMLGHGGISLMRPLGNTAGGLPFTVVFDAQGKVAHKVLGQIKPKELEQVLDAMLA
ncbi:TlpA family protein disulfide reductase [Eoetvoesiella caeni]|uniref:Thiol-disulfide isomerase/thioredoxin n=1 Tax=Eoetvoesiella caeni TaxID=645616 RepID=A0A366HCB7_9BURK|nr:TlpA disulfide reductase family protein [Eoetvoesiella caeni]MCI2809006.1 TlpA family protein disulfide reductase [Eoetvoesiella caeni]NYT55493.1 TlpA family protein disulfide reductase [Eoetvoesiella caeni]RBP40048.1 thiol-disulfide isomerase/thioredoxin [Eoetvoesiella caeni]